MEKYLNFYRKNKFRTPFEYAEYLNIHILFEDLQSINGFYHKMQKHRFIHINEALSNHEKKLTCAHELGHALLHPNINTYFLINNTFLSVNKLEREANIFAIRLLIPDDEIDNYKNFTIKQLAQLYGYPEELIKLRFLNKK